MGWTMEIKVVRWSESINMVSVLIVLYNLEHKVEIIEITYERVVVSMYPSPYTHRPSQLVVYMYLGPYTHRP